MRFAKVSFRPAFGRVLSVIVAAIAALGVAGFIITGDWAGLLRYGWGLGLLAALGIALFWMPRLDIDVPEVTVRNVFSTIHVPWPAIDRVDTKYALTLYTPIGRISVWASPAPSRYASQSANGTDAKLPAQASGSNIRPGDLLSTTSGAAAYVIRRHWEDLRADGHLESAVIEPGTLRRDIHWVTIAVLSVLLIGTILGIAL